MRKRRGLALIAATSVAVLLSGCGGSAGGSSSSGGTTTGITDKKVMIGLNSVLSGPQAVYQNIGLGAEAYLKAAEPINGYTFDFQEKDNALSAAQSASASRALATNSFMLVSGGTAPVQGMLTVTKALRVPAIGCANGFYYTPPKDQYAYGQNPDYARLVAADTRFMVETLGLKKLAYLYQNDDVGTPASKVIDDYAKSLGAEIVKQVPVPATTTDFSSFAATLADSGAEGVVFAGSPAELSGVQKAAIGQNYNPKWIGFWSLQDKSYTTTVPPEVLANTYSDAWMDPITGDSDEAKRYQQVVEEFNPKIVDSSLTEQGWNVGAVIAAAVKKATDGGQELTRENFIEAMQSEFTGQQVGLMKVKYDDKSHAAAAASAVYTLTAEGIGEQVQPMQDLPTP